MPDNYDLFAKCELPYFNAESQRIGVRLVTG